MPRSRTVYGWTDNGQFVISLQPRKAMTACNRYDTAREALRDAQQRKLVIIWEDPAAVDKG